jgi:hypothetical protein
MGALNWLKHAWVERQFDDKLHEQWVAQHFVNLSFYQPTQHCFQ